MRPLAYKKSRRATCPNPSAAHLLFALTLLGCQGGRDSSDSDEALAAEEFTECEPGNEDQLRRLIATHVSRIRIGLSRADMKLMDEHAQKLDLLKGACKEPFERACDVECTTRRASVHLFHANALQLLSNTASARMTTAEDTMLREANEGLSLVQEAASQLPRQRGFDAADAPDKTARGGYNAYLKAYAALRALHAELAMAAGDVWYRRASTAQARALNFFVSQTMGGSAGASNGGDDVNRSSAANYYEQAYWKLLDARVTLPTGDLGASPLFAAESSKVYALTEHVAERLRSLREGKLYIGIDPSGLQSNGGPGPARLTDLAAQLDTQYRELEKVEGQVGSLIDEWNQSTKELAQHDDTLAQLQSDRAIDLAAFKIGEIHDKTDKLRKGVEADLLKVGTERETLELQAQINAAQLKLEVDQREFAAEMDRIDLQKVEDMLQFDADGKRLELDRVSAAIDTTLTEFNFAMQLAGLDQQRRDAEQGKAQQELERGAVQSQISQVNLESSRQQTEIERMTTQIRGIDATQNEIMQAQIDSLNFQLAAIQADITFFTSNDPLIDQICQARTALLTAGVTSGEQLTQCLKGGSCPGGPSVEAAIKSLTAKKKSRAPAVVAQLNQQKNIIQTRINQLNGVMGEWQGSVGNAMIAARAASAAAAIAAAIPDGETGIMGPFPVKTFRICEAIADGLIVVADGLQFEAEYAGQKLGLQVQVDSEIAQLKASVAEIQNALNAANFEAELADVEEKQMLAELGARYLETKAGVEEREKQLIVHEFECNQQAGDNARNLERANAELKNVDAQLRAQTGERKNLDLERADRESLKKQAQLEIDRNNERLKELDVRLKQIESAISHFDATLAATDRQKAEVEVFQNKVKGLEQNKAEIERELDKLLDQAIAARVRSSDAAKAFVKQASSDAEKITLENIKSLQEQIDKIAQVNKLNELLATIEKDAQASLELHREELKRLMSAQPVPKAANLIWDFADVSAQITRGANELLDYKREVLASVNYYYNAYRFRYNLMGEFIGAGNVIEANPYIWTAADAMAKMSRCIFLGTTPNCAPSSLANSSQSVPISMATFTIERESAMFQELLRTGKTQFEFAPYAENLATSRKLGSFVLWDETSMKKSAEQRIIGIYLSFSRIDCKPATMSIRHTGLGYQVDGSGATTIEMRPPVHSQPAILTRGTSPGGNSDEAVRTQVGRLTNRALSIGGLVEELEKTGEHGLMPFLGYPLRGVYELNGFTENECLQQSPDMKLTVVFAIRTPSSSQSAR